MDMHAQRHRIWIQCKNDTTATLQARVVLVPPNLKPFLDIYIGVFSKRTGPSDMLVAVAEP
jgi:hypothetical protein